MDLKSSNIIFLKIKLSKETLKSIRKQRKLGTERTADCVPHAAHEEDVQNIY
jgi:hypothetical protein